MPEENANLAWVAQNSQQWQWASAQSWNDFILNFWDEEKDIKNDDVNWSEGFVDVAETIEPSENLNQWFDLSFWKEESKEENLDINTGISAMSQESENWDWGETSDTDFNLNLWEDLSSSQEDNSMEVDLSPETLSSEDMISPESDLSDIVGESETNSEMDADGVFSEKESDGWFNNETDNFLSDNESISDHLNQESASSEPEQQYFDLSEDVEEWLPESAVESIKESDKNSDLLSEDSVLEENLNVSAMEQPDEFASTEFQDSINDVKSWELEENVENSDAKMEESNIEQNLEVSTENLEEIAVPQNDIIDFTWIDFEPTENNIDFWDGEEVNSTQDTFDSNNMDAEPENDTELPNINNESNISNDVVLNEWEPQITETQMDVPQQLEANIDDSIENEATMQEPSIALNEEWNLNENTEIEFVGWEDSKIAQTSSDPAPEMVLDNPQYNQSINENVEAETTINSQENVATINMDEPLSEWHVDQSSSMEVQSTLSLDQILDSEILSQTEFSDKSVAVPNNVVESAWIFANKKMVVALVWVGIFLLVGFVASLAFPSGNSKREPNEVVSTWETLFPTEELEHWVSGNSPSSTETEIPLFPESDDAWEISWDTSSESTIWWATSTVIFPAVDDELEDTDYVQPSLYTWVEIYEKESYSDAVSIEEIMWVISSFKSQAESYYSYGQENQDRYLIKYATQIKYLCNNYEQRVKDGEWLDLDSLYAFRKEVNEALSKIDIHNNGWDSTVVVHSSTDESYFDGKDELTNYIYNR